MKKKATLSAVLAASMLLSLTACGTDDVTDLFSKIEDEITASESEVSTEEVTEEATEEETEAETEAETEEETEAETEEESEEETEEESSEAVALDLDYAEFKLADGLSESYADLDNRSFVLDGKLYTLGKTTFQQMIDDGVAFDEDDLNNAGNNVNKNYSTGYMTVKINDFNSVQFEYINMTDTNIKASECILEQVRWYSLYTPRAAFDDERNAEIVEMLNDAAEHIHFSFPLYLNKEDLLAKCPDGEEDDYNNVEYQVESTVYYGDSGYKFEFNDETNQLEEVWIDWLP